MTKRKTILRLVSMLTAVVLCIVGVPWSMQIVTYAESNQNRTKNFNKSYETGSTKAETMLNIAKAQIGKSGENLGYTEDWCADFVSDCAAWAGYAQQFHTIAIVIVCIMQYLLLVEQPLIKMKHVLETLYFMINQEQCMEQIMLKLLLLVRVKVYCQ